MKIAILHPETSWHFVPAFAKSLTLAGHEVRRFPYGSVLDELANAEEWGADVLVAEWANSAAAEISRHAMTPLVIRLHRYEVHEPHMRTIDWSSVRLLLVGSTEIRDLAVKANPDVAAVPCHVQVTPIDLDEWPLVERPPRNPTKIGVMANLDPRKNPFAWLELMHMLPREFTMHVVGNLGDGWLREWWDHAVKQFEGRVQHRGPIAHEDVAARRAFWSEMDWCFAPSLQETAGPMAAMEAAACGVTPVVYRFNGADKYWPFSMLYVSIRDAGFKIATKTEMPKWARNAAEEWSVQRRGAELAAAVAGCAR